MKLNIADYEVEIRAKFTGGGRIKNVKYNKDDTQALLNYLCILAGEAARRYEACGSGLSRGAYKTMDDIYDALNADNYYDRNR